MVGRFRRVGDAEFPGGGHVKCGVYEWSPGDPKKHGAFRIRFLSPDEPGPRIYYVEPLLRLWVTGRRTCFLERACEYGHRVLTGLEPSSANDRDVYEFHSALFRSRDKGHGRVGRRFNEARDFAALGESGTAELI